MGFVCLKDFVLGRLAKDEGVHPDFFAKRRSSEKLRADREVVLAVVQRDGLALKYASDDLRADRVVALAAVAKNGLALQHASAGLRADREIVLAAVEENGLALQHAHGDVRADRGVVLAAVMRDCRALSHASEDLRADRGIVSASVRAMMEQTRPQMTVIEYAAPDDCDDVAAAVAKNQRQMTTVAAAVRGSWTRQLSWRQLYAAPDDDAGISSQYATVSSSAASTICTKNGQIGGTICEVIWGDRPSGALSL